MGMSRTPKGRHEVTVGAGTSRRGVIVGAGVIVGVVVVGGGAAASVYSLDHDDQGGGSAGAPPAGTARESKPPQRVLDSLQDHAKNVPDATLTDLAKLSIPVSVSYPRLPSARGLSEALDISANKILREHRYAGSSAGDLEITGTVFATARDTIGAMLRQKDAAGESTSAIYYRAKNDRPFTSPGLVGREKWPDFEKAIAAAAKSVDGMDADSLASVLQEQPRPWGNGPTLIPAKNGDLHALFPAAEFDGKHSTAEIVITAGRAAPLLSEDGKAVLAAVKDPTRFDPTTVRHPAPDKQWGDKHYIEPREAPAPKPARSADSAGPIAQLAPRSGRGTRPSSVAAPDATRLKVIALTFDDGPDPDQNQTLRDHLDQRHAAATFFMIGESVSSFPTWCTKTAVAGFEVGSHSWSHPQLSALHGEKLEEQISKAADAIEKATGRPPFVMRPPYGAHNSRSNDMIGKYGESSIIWDVDTLDWKTLSVDKNISNVREETTRGSIVLMHEIHPTSVRSLPQILDWFVEEDYTLLTSSEVGQNQMYAGRYYMTGLVTHEISPPAPIDGGSEEADDGGEG